MHRSTEFCHWREASVSSSCSFAANESEESVSGTEDMDIQQENGELHELPGVVGSPPDCRSRSDPLDSCSRGTDPVTQEKTTSPLKKIVLKAVLDAMAIVDDSGVSVKTFEDILEYGKTMLLTSVGDECRHSACLVV